LLASNPGNAASRDRVQQPLGAGLAPDGINQFEELRVEFSIV